MTSVLDQPIHKCPFPACRERTHQFACPKDWARIPRPERQAIIAELKAMKQRGQTKPTKALHATYIEALKAIIRIEAPERAT